MALDFNTREMRAKRASKAELELPTKTENKPDTPEFPIAALGPIMGDAVEAISYLADVDKVMAAQSVLFVASMAAQCHMDVEKPHGGKTILSTWFVTIAASGERKSTSDNYAMRPIKEREASLHETYKHDLASYLDKDALYKADRAKIIKSKGASREDELSALVEPLRPLGSVLTVSTPTIEALVKKAPFAQAGFGLANDEGGQFLSGYAFSPENRRNAMTTLSKLWDGSPITKWLASEELEPVKNKRVALHLMVQPKMALSLIGAEDAKDQGILGRMFVAKPQSRIGSRMFDLSAEATAKRNDALHRLEAWNRHIKEVLQRPIQSPEGCPAEVTPPLVGLSDDAKFVWRDFHNATEGKQVLGAEYREIIPLASKMGEMVLRLAGMFTVLETPNAETISASTVSRACEIGQFYLDEAVRIDEEAYKDQEIELAEAAMRWLTEKWDGDIISPPDIYQRIIPTKLRCKKAFAPILHELVASGQLVYLTDKQQINGKTRMHCYRIVKSV